MGQAPEITLNSDRLNWDGKVARPWGGYEVLTTGSGFQVKRLTVQPREATSLQVHAHRDEHWVVVQGVAAVIKGEANLLLSSGEAVFIHRGEKHRLTNLVDIPLIVIEIQYGDYLGEDDIVRLEDRYGRV